MGSECVEEGSKYRIQKTENESGACFCHGQLGNSFSAQEAEEKVIPLSLKVNLPFLLFQKHVDSCCSSIRGHACSSVKVVLSSKLSAAEAYASGIRPCGRAGLNFL